MSDNDNALRVTLTAHQAMLNAHEDRLQSIENVQRELVSSVAEQNATLKAFSRQMQMMTDSVCEKLDNVSERLVEKIGNVSEVSKSLVGEQKEQSNRIGDLEKREVREIKAFDWKLKTAYTALSAGGGAILMVLIEYIKRAQ